MALYLNSMNLTIKNWLMKDDGGGKILKNAKTQKTSSVVRRN